MIMDELNKCDNGIKWDMTILRLLQPLSSTTVDENVVEVI